MTETLQVWIVTSNRGSETVDYLTLRIAPFLRTHADVKIEFRLLSWSTARLELIHAFKNGTSPDVFEFGTTWVGVFAHMSALEPVPNGFPLRPAIAPWYDEVVRYKNTNYAVPWTVDTTCFMARSDILEKLCIGKETLLTWQDFQDISEAVMAWRHAAPAPSGLFPKPITFPCGPEPVTLHRIFPWLSAGGFDFGNLGAESLPVLTSPEIRPGLQYIRTLVRIGQMTREEGRSSLHHQHLAFFRDGATAFLTTGWYHVMCRIREGTDAYESSWPSQVMRLPYGPGGSIAYGGGSLLGVSPHSKNKELAWNLVLALTEPEVLEEFALWAGTPPAYTGPFWERNIGRHDVQVLLSTLQEARHYPVYPVWSAMERTLAVGVGELLGYLAQHDYDEYAMNLSASVDAELARWRRLAWEVV